MLRHIAMFRWVDGTTPAQRQAIRESLAGLRAVIPEIRDYRFGDDAGLTDGNWDFVVVADFDDEAGWRAYVANPDHQRVIADHIRPVVAERAAVQLQM